MGSYRDYCQRRVTLFLNLVSDLVFQFRIYFYELIYSKYGFWSSMFPRKNMSMVRRPGHGGTIIRFCKMYFFPLIDIIQKIKMYKGFFFLDLPTNWGIFHNWDFWSLPLPDHISPCKKTISPREEKYPNILTPNLP